MERSYPFDVGQGAAISATDWSLMARRWRGSGVNKGDQNGLAVTAGSGLQSVVASGSGFVRGHFYTNDAAKPLAHAAADATFGRLDLVVLELNLTDLNNPGITARVVTGTPSGSPVMPGLTQSSTIHQIPLASVLVPALASAVSTITDKRPWSGRQPIEIAPTGTATVATTTYSDIGGLGTPEIYTDGGDIDVTVMGSCSLSHAGGVALIGLAIDGGTEVFVGQVQSSNANEVTPFCARTVFAGVAAGFHFLRARALVLTAGHTLSVNNSRRLIWTELN